MNAGARVRSLRESQGISRSELARRSGVGVTTIRDLEVFDRDPKISTYEKLLLALGWRLCAIGTQDAQS